MTDHVSWRWCFWINLPTGGAAALVLFLFLNLNPTKKQTVRSVAATFDFLGLFLIMGGVVLVLIGFQGAETARNGWHAPATLGPLIVGIVLLLLGVVNEIFTSRQPIVPPRLFKTRTTAGILISVFLHALTFFEASYYIPLYFQILGSSATGSGVRQLPLSLGSSGLAIISGLVVAKTGRYRPIMWFGFVVMTLGYGLFIMLEQDTSVAKQEIWLLVGGIGIGCLFQPPLIGLQAAMPLKDMATSTATFGLLRTLGGAVGIAVGDTIFASELTKRLAKVQGFDSTIAGEAARGDYSALAHIQPESLREQVLHAYTRSLVTIYIVAVPLSFVGLLAVLCIHEYSLKRNIQRGGKEAAAAAPGAGEDAGAMEKEVRDSTSQEPVSKPPIIVDSEKAGAKASETS